MRSDRGFAKVDKRVAAVVLIALCLGLAACFAGSPGKPNGDNGDLAKAASSDGGIASLLGDGTELVDGGPSRDEFESDDEWGYYWAHFHERDVALKYGMPIVKDERGRQYVPGEVTLVVEEGVSDDQIARMAADRGLRVADISRSRGLPSVVTVYSDDIGADVDEMGSRFDGVEGVAVGGPNWAGYALDDLAAGIEGRGDAPPSRDLPSPLDPDSGNQIYLAQAGFAEAWEDTTCDGSVSIAVLDTAVDPIHEDLSVPLGTYGQEGVHPGGGGHGTAVAGVACAEMGNGLGMAGCSGNAALVPIVAALPNGNSSFTMLYDALCAVRNRVEIPDVVNVSLSIAESDFTLAQIAQLDAVVAALVNLDGCVVVASAGNACGSNELRYPAACPGAIGVGAVEPSGLHMEGYVSNGSVDLCALGDYIYTTTDPTSDLGQGNSYADSCRVGTVTHPIAGTSFSAPQVSAAAALVKAKHPGWSPGLITRALVETASHPSDFADADGDGRDDLGRYGYGALDAAAAVGWTAPGGSPDTGGSLAEMYAEARR